MTKKCILFSTIFAFVFTLTLAGGVCSATDPGPADMTLKTEAGKKPSIFPHKKHQETMKCGDCHHLADADGKQKAYAEGDTIKKCASCHNADMANPKLNSYKLAAHANCKGCHKKAAKEGKNAPTKCAGCHPKKEE